MKPLKNSILAALIVNILFIAPLRAEIVERIVAYVDDYAITKSELNKTLMDMRESLDKITEEEAVNALINRVLLLKEAKKMKLDPPESNQIKEYIDIKIKSLIFIREEDLQRYYDSNKGTFKNIPFASVKDKIEQLLIEEETNRRLQDHLQLLRNKAYIKIQLTPLKRQ